MVDWPFDTYWHNYVDILGHKELEQYIPRPWAIKIKSGSIIGSNHIYGNRDSIVQGPIGIPDGWRPIHFRNHQLLPVVAVVSN